VLGVLIAILGILADLSATNRRLTEEMFYHLKRREMMNGRAREDPDRST
jgi:hypothetical protein